MSAPSLHIESTDSMIHKCVHENKITVFVHIVVVTFNPSFFLSFSFPPLPSGCNPLSLHLHLSLLLLPSSSWNPASFDMKIPVDGLFFAGIQLATISNTGRVAIWQSVQQHWQVRQTWPPSPASLPRTYCVTFDPWQMCGSKVKQ